MGILQEEIRKEHALDQKESCYRVPCCVITDARFHRISVNARYLYLLLFIRMENDAKLDEEGHPYLEVTAMEVAEALDCSIPTAYHCFSELEGIGVIKRVRQGIGFPCRVYME